MKVKKAVFPIAGLGTRFLPATKSIPKEMLPILNKPIIQYVVEEASRAGIEEFIFVTSKGKSAVEDHFDIAHSLNSRLIERKKDKYFNLVNDIIPQEGKFYFTRQQHNLGLGHAVMCAKQFIKNEPFVVILPDEVFFEKEKESHLAKMISFFENKGGKSAVIAAKKVEPSSVSSYGIFDLVNKGEQEQDILKAKGIIEKPSVENSPSNYANIGRYVLPPEIFDILEHAQPSKDNEIQLTDAIAKLLDSKELFAYVFNGKRHDCGNPFGMLAAWIDAAYLMPDWKVKLEELLKLYIK